MVRSRTQPLLLAVVLLAGLALNGSLLPAKASAPLLPRLEAEPPDGQYYETSSFEGANRLLLKFNGYIHNGGKGAVDIRGQRSAPSVKQSTREQVERDRGENRETLSESELGELATPEMGAVQREFTTNFGERENEIEREHVDRVPSGAELLYSAADGHDHWHLQHLARYTLASVGGAGEATPAQKVGFCLDDSLHTDKTKGPSNAVYADNVPPFREFCQRLRPDATSLFEGISIGWSDLYGSYLAWQWVDASNVIPGEYVLHEEVDPEHFLEEETGGEKTASSATTIVPGYDAEPQSADTGVGQSAVIALRSRKFVASAAETVNPETHKRTEAEAPGPVAYAIAQQPQHGHVTINGTLATYTPQAGFTGTDRFTYTAADSQSEYPWHPLEATATVVVGDAPPAPEITITQGPSGLTTGTSAKLTAVASNDASGIEWSASGGTIEPQGSGESATFTAPSTAGEVTVTATLRDHDKSTSREIAITAPPPSEPAPAVPSPETAPQGAGGVAGSQEVARGLSRPRAMLFGRRLVITTTPEVAGRIRVTAFSGKHLIGRCGALTPSGRQFTCRIKLAPRISLHSRISITATLKHGPHSYFTSRLAAAVIAQMRMVPAGNAGGAHVALVDGMWCSPSSLVPTLEG